jgi:transcriptional regulator with XRE-family HTH domain
LCPIFFKSMNNKNFGTTLRDLRKKAGISQKELAIAIGVGDSYISKIENGILPPPSTRVVIKIAEYLKVDRDELLILAGKLPGEIAQLLEDQETLRFLRAKGAKNMIKATNIIRKGTNNLVKGGLAKVTAGKWSRISVSIFLTLTIIGALIRFSTPAAAVNMQLINLPALMTTGTSYTFTAQVNIDSDERIPISNLSLALTGPTAGNVIFDPNGSISSQSPANLINSIIPQGTPTYNQGFGYGYGLGYGNAGSGYYGSKWDYGYGYTGITQLTYSITLNTSVLAAGSYTAQLKANVPQGYSQVGMTEVGTHTTPGTDWAFANSYSVSSSWTPNYAVAYVNCPITGITIRAGLYEYVSNIVPGALLAKTADVSVPVGEGWIKMPFNSPPNLNAGNFFLMVSPVGYDPNSDFTIFSSTVPVIDNLIYGHVPAGNLPDPWLPELTGGPDFFTGIYNMDAYVDYTPTGGAVPTQFTSSQYSFTLSSPMMGGGGSGVYSVPITTSGFNSGSELATNTSGYTQSAVNLSTPDGKLSLGIPSNTRLWDVNSVPLTTITATVNTAAPAAPTGNSIVFACNLGPEGAQFNPPITLTLNYDPAALPAGVVENDLYIANYVNGQWVSLGGTVDTNAHTITIQISHFSTYALMGKVTVAPQPTPSTTPITTVTATATPIASVTPTVKPTPKPTTTPTASAPASATPLAIVSNTPTQTQPDSTTPPPSGGHNWALIAIIIVAVLAVIVVLAILLMKRPNST